MRSRLMATCMAGAALAVFGMAFGPADGRAAAGDDVFGPLPADTATLDAYKWQNRPVLLFAPGKDDSAYAEQMHIFETARAGLAEREVVVLSDTAPDDGGALREAYGIDGFTMILVGKDGTMKLRDHAPIPAAELFARIDSMPMRRREMRE